MLKSCYLLAHVEYGDVVLPDQVLPLLELIRFELHELLRELLVLGDLYTGHERLLPLGLIYLVLLLLLLVLSNDLLDRNGLGELRVQLPVLNRLRVEGLSPPVRVVHPVQPGLREEHVKVNACSVPCPIHNRHVSRRLGFSRGLYSFVNN